MLPVHPCKLDGVARLHESGHLGSGADLLHQAELTGHKILQDPDHAAIFSMGYIGSVNRSLLGEPVPLAWRRRGTDLGGPVRKGSNVEPMRLHEVRAEAGRDGAAPVEVVHQPGIVAGEAGTALLAPLRTGAAATRNMSAVSRAVDLGVAKAPQAGENAQAQG
ncbi:hypothetical protein GCM10010052_05690 [Paenarthrobacter histidinolovorans]|nr:hypothetical protein GCM10010052_05690 [Paenarthrobacter histidinolovorans]